MRAAFLAACALGGLGACADAGSNPSTTVPGPRSGFVTLSPLDVELGDAGADTTGTAPAARLFYRFAPARTSDARRRLCMLFNGGPGAGSELLWLNLGPGAQAEITTLCHALFLDPRNTGLSYELVDDPDTHVPSPASYNAYVDAADALRALRHAVDEIGLDPVDEVVLVGESYGGVRVSLMLELAWQGGRAGDAPFHAGALEGELRELFALEHADASALFRHAVLLQPDVAGSLQDQVTGELLQQPGSPLHALADELGATLDPCNPPDCVASEWAWDAVTSLGRSPYDYTAGSDWFDRLIGEAQDYGQTALPLELAHDSGLGSDLRASGRTRAFRFADVTAPADDSSAWSTRYGQLGSHDRYFAAYSREIAAGFETSEARALGIAGSDPRHGSAFVKAARRLSFFVTRGEHDLITYPAALGPTLERLPEIAKATLETTSDARPGEWHLEYRDGGEARLRAPAYAASHAVAHDRPREVLADVAAWLDAN